MRERDGYASPSSTPSFCNFPKMVSSLNLSLSSMAVSGQRFLLLISVLLTLIALSAASRPGPYKTIIFFSTPSSPHRNLPFFSFYIFQRPSLPVFFSRLRNFYPESTLFVDRTVVSEQAPPLRSGFYSSALHDRIMKFLLIIGSLLAGAGCGALSAIVIYLMLSRFASDRFEFVDFDNDVSPKTMECLPVPKADSIVGVPPTKEVV